MTLKSLTLVAISAMAAFMLSGCNKMGVEMPEVSQNGLSAGNEIGFSVYTGRAVTKATSLAQDFSVESFLSVSGSGTRTQFFPSTIYRYAEATGKYTGDITRYWPAATSQNLDFYATSPLQYTNTSSSSVDLAPANDSTFTVTKTDGSTDIVAARVLKAPNGTAPETVTLTFGHKLTKVAFKAIGQDTQKKYVITDLILTANSTSTYSYEKATSPVTAEAWSTSSDATDYDYVSSNVTIAGGTTSSVSVGSAKYLIPDQASTLTATVKYQILDGTTVIDDNTAGVSITLPTDKWGINKSVVYNLKLGFSSAAKVIVFDAEVNDWESDQTVDVIVPEVVSEVEAKFSVSATKQVHFTKGNLYWNSSESAWHLETHQYDYRNYNGLISDVAVINGVSTSTPTGTIGSFYFTTSAATSYALSFNNGTSTDKLFCDGSDDSHKLTVEGKSGLYCLSQSEWVYLLNSRSSTLKKWCVTVNGVANCLILAPDDYTGTIASSYDSEAWASAESSGLVCLPPAYTRTSTEVVTAGLQGAYWSSTVESVSTAYSMCFYTNTVSPNVVSNGRGCGHSIRLVYTAE